MPIIFMTYNCSSCDKEVKDLNDLHEFQIVPIEKNNKPLEGNLKYSQWLCNQCSNDLKVFLDRNIARTESITLDSLMD